MFVHCTKLGRGVGFAIPQFSTKSMWWNFEKSVIIKLLKNV